MSLESAKAFYELVISDEDLANRLSEAESEEGVREIIQAQGDFDFTQDEWKDAVLAGAGVEMSDSDLEEVAGGQQWSGSNDPIPAPPPIYLGGIYVTLGQ